MYTVGLVFGLVDVGLVFGLLVVGLVVGDVVGLAVCSALSQTEASYVAVEIEAHSANVGLKNPISFHVGRIEISTSQTYDRTKFVTSPCPGKRDPNYGVKWYGSGPKYVSEDPHET
jgi:hypothetical protein